MKGPPLSRISIAALLVAGAVIALTQFVSYCTFRGMESSPGLILPARLMLVSSLVPAVFGLMLTLPFAAAIVCVLIWQQWRIPMRRAKAWRCFWCGHPLPGERCVECGHDAASLGTGHDVHRSAVRCVCLLWATGIVLGSFAGEAWVAADDLAFRRVVQEDPTIARWRARRWPNGNSTVHYSPGRGFWGMD